MTQLLLPQRDLWRLIPLQQCLSLIRIFFFIKEKNGNNERKRQREREWEIVKHCWMMKFRLDWGGKVKKKRTSEKQRRGRKGSGGTRCLFHPLMLHQWMWLPAHHSPLSPFSMPGSKWHTLSNTGLISGFYLQHLPVARSVAQYKQGFFWRAEASAFVNLLARMRAAAAAQSETN